jgi:hypothetical protein
MPCTANRRSHRHSIEINPFSTPDPGNVHTWLSLVGDAVGTMDARVMYGCLQPVFQGQVNSASAFTAAKISLDTTPGPPCWTPNAVRTEVLLPSGADDRFADPRILMETVDAELPAKAKALLAYFAFTFPTSRLHEQYELVRDFTRRLIVDPFRVGAVLVHHAPHRAGSANQPHVHVMIAGPRRLTALGLGEWVRPLIATTTHALVRDAFLAAYDNWHRGGSPNGSGRS